MLIQIQKTTPFFINILNHVRNFSNHIDTFGYENYFYKMKQIYFDYNGYTYWHMENIINRCVIEDTYHIRKLNNRLPKK